jgi:integrase/recombinase XerD
MLQDLFDKFLEEAKYIMNHAENTLKAHKRAFNTYRRFCPGDDITETSLKEFTIKARIAEMTPRTFNCHAAHFNTFLRWLADNHITQPLRIKYLPEPKKSHRSFTEEEVRKFLKYRPRYFGEKRMYALICTLTDTGCRINELLTLTRENLHLDELLMEVIGKGSKLRVVPFSIELREILRRFLKTHEYGLVFPTNTGRKLGHSNIHRDFQIMCAKLQIKPSGFHTFRRTFARQYLKQGGNLFYLQASLGHTRLETTRRYVEVEKEDLLATHKKVSILSRLKS